MTTKIKIKINHQLSDMLATTPDKTYGSDGALSYYRNKALNSINRKNFYMSLKIGVMRYLLNKGGMERFIDFIVSSPRGHQFLNLVDADSDAVTTTTTTSAQRRNKRVRNAARARGREVYGRREALEFIEKAAETRRLAEEIKRRRDVVRDMPVELQERFSNSYFNYDGAGYSQTNLAAQVKADLAGHKVKVKTRGVPAQDPDQAQEVEPAADQSELRETLSLAIMEDAPGRIVDLVDRFLSPVYQTDLKVSDAVVLLESMGAEFVRPRGGSSHMKVQGLTDACYAEIEDQVVHIPLTVPDDIEIPEVFSDQELMAVLAQHERKLTKAQFFDIQTLILKVAVHRSKSED